MHLEYLGLDVIKLILFHVSVQDIVRFSSTNSLWRKLLHIKSNLFKSLIDLQRRKYPIDILVKDRTKCYILITNFHRIQLPLLLEAFELQYLP
jgi:hypothetical protein